MSFLDQKEVIYDVVLTDRGRELMARNQLNFQYYAFSDEGVNYTEHLSSSLVLSQSIDNLVRKNLFFESDQRKDRDLKSFLYTIPIGKKVLPRVNIENGNVYLTSSTTLERRYSVGTLEKIASSMDNHPPPIDIVVKLTIPDIDEQTRHIRYGRKQIVKSILLRKK